MKQEVSGRKGYDLWYLSNLFKIKGGKNGRRKKGEGESLGCDTRV
jgi:hypothetical protein